MFPINICDLLNLFQGIYFEFIFKLFAVEIYPICFMNYELKDLE